MLISGTMQILGAYIFGAVFCYGLYVVIRSLLREVGNKKQQDSITKRVE